MGFLTSAVSLLLLLHATKGHLHPGKCEVLLCVSRGPDMDSGDCHILSITTCTYVTDRLLQLLKNSFQSGMWNHPQMLPAAKEPASHLLRLGQHCLLA
ncbi:hypothetical protein MATL_G00242350 [Megalops atlanticus]|uniref:Uncharacterized protein n=1 Tax=Megalops atlanticus TaxID=7932 RepID=A0A9D3T1G1_MEGAT|nr:hypothetical protein MATL_G00242350 [Megalops atlanticus]